MILLNNPLQTASKRTIQKTAEANGDLIGNKIDDKITSGSKTSPQNNSEANEEEMLWKKYIYRTKAKIADDLRLQGN